MTVRGLAARTTITNADAGDRLTVNGLAGNDTIDASALAAGQVDLALNGGAGNDTLIGSHGNDTVAGGIGNDVAQLGDGDDTFVWNPGDGSDTVEGQGGTDTLLFNGANVNENMDISANGSRVTDDPRRWQRHDGSQWCREHQRRPLSAAPTHHGGRPDRHRCRARSPSTWPVSRGTVGGDGQIDTITINGTSGRRRDHAHRQRRRAHGGGSGRHRDDLQLRPE